jgi:hypothetical protein
MWKSSSPIDFLRFPEDKNKGYKAGGGDLNEQLEWNEDNQLKVEYDKQLEVDSHLVIVPLD